MSEGKILKIIELFAGIGACSSALDRLNIKHEIVDAVEIDKYAIKSFNAIHNTNFEIQDITKWDKNFNDIDLIIHGSPCQDFSVAGKQAGGDFESGTRSSLLYETIKIVGKLRPKYVIWENVKNILSEKHKHNFYNYIETLNILGYNSYYQVLNAKDYGIPQNRERVFTISIRKDIDGCNFKFPNKEKLKIRLKDMLENEVDEKYYWNNKTIQELRKENIEEVKYKWNIRVKDFINDSRLKENTTYSLDAYNKNISEISQTLTTPHNVNFILDKNKIRKLTPREYWRLMGFDDEDFEKAKKINSDTQLYKQAGNSIVVNVLQKILLNLFKKVEEEQC